MAGARKHWLIAVAAAGGILVCGVAALGEGSIAERLHLATRLTVRWSAWWFAAAFAARPLHQAFGGIWTELLRQRRYLGLGFAAAHGVHALAFSTLIIVTGDKPPLTTLVGGSIGYAFLVAMAVTSNDAAQRALGRWWKRLHTTGMWVLWVIFAVGYVRGMAKPGMFPFAALLSIALIVPALLRIPTLRRLVTLRRARPTP